MPNPNVLPLAEDFVVAAQVPDASLYFVPPTDQQYQPCDPSFRPMDADDG